MAAASRESGGWRWFVSTLSRPILGVSTTCTATSGNGWRIAGSKKCRQSWRWHGEVARLRPSRIARSPSVPPDQHACSCEGFRMPAHRNGGAGTGAGVRKPPGKERASSGGKRAPRVLWGFRCSGVAAGPRRTTASRVGWIGDGARLRREAGLDPLICMQPRLYPTGSVSDRTSTVAASP